MFSRLREFSGRIRRQARRRFGNGIPTATNSDRFFSQNYAPFVNRSRAQLPTGEERIHPESLPATVVTAATELAATLASMNRVVLYLFTLFVVLLIVQTRHVLESRRQWAILENFFTINHELMSRSQLEDFAYFADCRSLVLCLGAIVRYSVDWSVLRDTQLKGFAPEYLSNDASPSSDLDKLDEFIEKFYSSKLAYVAIQEKETLILKQLFEDVNIPTATQQRFVSLLNLSSLGHLRALIELIEQSDRVVKYTLNYELQMIERQMVKDLCAKFTQLLDSCPDKMATDDNKLVHVRRIIWKRLENNDRKRSWNIVSLLVFVLTPLIPIFVMDCEFRNPFKVFGRLVQRDNLCGDRTHITFNQPIPTTVQDTVIFQLHFFCMNSNPYTDEIKDLVEVEVVNSQTRHQCLFQRTNSELFNEWQTSFPARVAGAYNINISVHGEPIDISPIRLRLRSSSPMASNIRIMNYLSSVLTSPTTPQNELHIQLYDKFGNVCDDNIVEDAVTGQVRIKMREVATNKEENPTVIFQMDSQSRIFLFWNLPKLGIFEAEVFYRGEPILNGRFHIYSLSSSELALIDKQTCDKAFAFRTFTFQAKMLLDGSNSESNKFKNVTLSLSSKRLTVITYTFGMFPRQITSFRLSPSTKIRFARDQFDDQSLENISLRCPDKDAFVIIDDGCQNPVELLMAERNSFIGIFMKMLLSKIGGRDIFPEKKVYFSMILRKIHEQTISCHECRSSFKISRNSILADSIRATRGYNASDWASPFNVQFLNEPGIDFGGVSKEWFELVCRELFEPQEDPRKSLFRRFTSNKQGLVHPNSQCTLSNSYYKFAGLIVGKSLFNEATRCGPKFTVNARFTRSFLSQLVGLGTSYRQFKTDDPELFEKKVQLILNNDVTDFNLYFAEEEYDTQGNLVKTHDLISRGSRTPVTEQNKREYLERFAQFRLRSSVASKVEAFMRGLTMLVPEDLLSIFEINELELLICGAEKISLSDLRKNHLVSGSNDKIINWFWGSLSTFSDEEMARLLQFTTGSSRLPAGGFVDLSPQFQISIAPEYCFGKLPSAHTCFNQIELPDYKSFKEFDKFLRIAINEGNEGFLLS